MSCTFSESLRRNFCCAGELCWIVSHGCPQLSENTYPTPRTVRISGVGEFGVVHLVTHVFHVHIHQVGGVVERHVPDVLHDHGPGHGLPRISHQVFQQGKFFARQIDTLARPLDPKLAAVERQVPNLKGASRQVWIPSQQSPDPGQELGK